jgi:hypothetical protein
MILDQLIRFPAGANDDAVDALGIIGRALDQAHPAITVAKPRPKTEAEARIDYLENPTIMDPLEREMMELEKEFARDDILGDRFFSDWDEPGRRELVYTSTVD